MHGAYNIKQAVVLLHFYCDSEEFRVFVGRTVVIKSYCTERKIKKKRGDYLHRGGT